MKLRVGVVGLGDAWESRHRPALRAMSDRFEVRAFCDPVHHLAEQAARDFQATTMDGFRALAARQDIDVVFILGAQWYGALPILAACDAGKGVYCAAALDLDPAQAKGIKDRVERAGIAFMAEFPRRTMPATLRLKELIATRLGKPRLLFCHARRRTVADRRNGASRAGYPYPTGVRETMELVDWCRYVVGDEPTSVVGIQHGAPGGEESDYRMLSLDFSEPARVGSGVLAHISFGSYLSPQWPEAVSFRPPAALQVCCEQGVAFVDLPATLVWFDNAGQHMESLENELPVGERLLTQFHRAVTSLVRRASDLEDAYRALHIVQCSRTSFQENRRVSLEF